MEGNKGNTNFCKFICKAYCPYYKPSSLSNKFTCYGFILAQEIIQKYPQYDFLLSSPLSGPEFVYQYDPHIYKLVCQKCDFLKDGCDFRAQQRLGPKKHYAPCGGYIFITRLITDKYFMVTSNGRQPLLRPLIDHGSRML